MRMVLRVGRMRGDGPRRPVGGGRDVARPPGDVAQPAQMSGVAGRQLAGALGRRLGLGERVALQMQGGEMGVVVGIEGVAGHRAFGPGERLGRPALALRHLAQPAHRGRGIARPARPRHCGRQDGMGIGRRATRQMQIGEMIMALEILRMVRDGAFRPGEGPVPVAALHQGLAQPALVVTGRLVQRRRRGEGRLRRRAVPGRGRHPRREIGAGRILPVRVLRARSPEAGGLGMAARELEFGHAPQGRGILRRRLDGSEDGGFRSLEIPVALLQARQIMQAVDVPRRRRGRPLRQGHGLRAAAELHHDLGETAEIAGILGLDVKRADEMFRRLGVAPIAHAEQAEMRVAFGVARIGRERPVGPLAGLLGLALLPAQLAETAQQPGMVGIEIERPAQQALSGQEVAVPHQIGGRPHHRAWIGRVDAWAGVIVHRSRFLGPDQGARSGGQIRRRPVRQRRGGGWRRGPRPRSSSASASAPFPAPRPSHRRPG